MSTQQSTAGRATFARSLRLFRSFLSEQSDPVGFYTTLAEDSVGQLSNYIDLSGRTVLDVGGGPGYFGRAFQAAGARYVGLELDVPADLTSEVSAIRGSGERIPLRSASVDVAYSSNVIEHVRQPWVMADEMVRVTASGGIVFLSFTPWLSPWGGHETAPWHLLGGSFARRRYVRRNGREPKNAYGETLFGYRAADLLRWARGNEEVDIIAALPRYHPRWAWWVALVPGLRECATWNFVVVLRRR